jgi:hypothetical protein
MFNCHYDDLTPLDSIQVKLAVIKILPSRILKLPTIDILAKHSGIKSVKYMPTEKQIANEQLLIYLHGAAAVPGKHIQITRLNSNPYPNFTISAALTTNPL